MDNTLLEKIQRMNNEIEFANTVINLQFLLLEVIAGPCWRAGTIYFLITPNKMFLHMSAALKHKIKKKHQTNQCSYTLCSFLAFPEINESRDLMN